MIMEIKLQPVSESDFIDSDVTTIKMCLIPHCDEFQFGLGIMQHK